VCVMRGSFGAGVHFGAMRLTPKRRKTATVVGKATDAAGSRGSCAWCGTPLTTVRGRFCSRKCRQNAFRLRRREGAIDLVDQVEKEPMTSRRQPLRFAYLDLVAHGARVPASLGRDLRGFDGWAISASPAALRELLGRFGGRRDGRAVHVCAWCLPTTTAPDDVALRPSWEALIVRSPRKARGVTDSLFAGGRRADEPTDRRPVAFGAWVIAVLGLLPGDQLVADGLVARAWRELGGASVEKESPRRRRRPRPRQLELGGQKHPPAEGSEVPADPPPLPPSPQADETN
jgi:hypothetical protein